MTIMSSGDINSVPVMLLVELMREIVWGKKKRKKKVFEIFF